MRVTWLDHWADQGESTPQDWEEGMSWTSVGWVVRETATVLSLARDISDVGKPVYGDVLHIYRALITEIQDVGLPVSQSHKPTVQLVTGEGE